MAILSEKSKIPVKKILLIVGALLLLAFVTEFIVTWVEYSQSRKYRDRMEKRTYDVRNLNRYKRLRNVKMMRLEKLRRRYKLEFARSELKAAFEKAAGKARIPVNNISIEWIDTKKKKNYQALELKLRMKTSFLRLGAFMAIIEGDGQEKFSYALRIERLSIAALKRSGARVSAQIQILVFKRA